MKLTMHDITPSRPSSSPVPGFLRPAMRTLQAISSPAAAFLAERLFFRAPRNPVTVRGREFLATGRRFELRVDGRKVVGWSWGEGNPVYLVHGWGGPAARLHTLAQPIVDAGHPLVLFDAPGHGQSGKGMSSMPEFARALEAVVARHGPAHAIVAHSLGAAATALALVHGVVAHRVVFLAPPANPAEWASSFAAAVGLKDDVMRQLRSRSERRLRFKWDDLDICVHARTMATPLLVIHDRSDETVPWANGAAIANAWPGARLVETGGLGHRGLLRDPGVISKVLEFIAAEGDLDEATISPAVGAAAQLEYELFHPATRWS